MESGLNEYTGDDLATKLVEFMIEEKNLHGYVDPLTHMIFDADCMSQIDALCLMSMENGPYPDYLCAIDPEIRLPQTGPHPQTGLLPPTGPLPPMDNPAGNISIGIDTIITGQNKNIAMGLDAIFAEIAEIATVEPPDNEDDDEDPYALKEMETQSAPVIPIKNTTHATYLCSMYIRDDITRDILVFPLYIINHVYAIDSVVTSLQNIYLKFCEHNAVFRNDTIGTIESDPVLMKKFIMGELSKKKLPSISWDGEISKMWNERDFTHDVVFEFPNGLVYAHKLILIRSGEWFRVAFTGMTPLKTTLSGNVILEDISRDDFLSVLKYIYTGKVDLEKINIDGVSKLADYFDIKHLKTYFELM